MNRTFETELLRIFVTVAECGGFTRASEALNSTQSTVSAQIKRLEEQAGHPLFQRNTRSVQLTPAGKVLLGYARTILRINEDAYRKLSGAAPFGRIRFGVSEDLAGGWLPRVLRRFAVQFPDVLVELEIGIGPDLLRRLEEGGLDAVVSGRCGEDPGGHRLWREPLVWAFSQGAEIPAPLRLALFPEPCPYRDAALLALGGTDQSWTISCTSASLSGVRAAALAGLAVTPLPRSLVGAELRIVSDLPAILPPLPEMEYVARIGRHSSSPAIAALIELIESVPGAV